MSKKIITVFGATGAQGGSVVDTFLQDPALNKDWKVRGVTRDVTRENSKKLAARGVEVVGADVHDKASVVKAMTGAHTVYAVTNYWDPSIQDKEKDVAIGKNMADAAKETGVQHYIWSSLKNVTELSNGSLTNVHHFDSKAIVEQYIRSLNIPATFFLPGFYMSNFASGMFTNKTPSGKWTLSMPVPSSAPVPLFAARQDTGKFVKAIVLNREQLLGKQVLGATESISLADMLDIFKKTFPQAGATAEYVQVPKDAYIDGLAKSGMAWPLEMYENMRLLKDFGYYGGDSLQPTHKLVKDKLTTWAEFIKTTPPYADLK
ncbi:hypothetical protein TD95_004030 [Thielaviopsis punctulata]|uniref:NmrA-like domain-containing protein n=1 Tax=Thielaviopsis punctulata TaxID=72032 RepID=A0A0F4ZG48_9PEZI|nr:hypothetical protein TD95_004030 [Thielaviopsis punctulata]